MPPVTPPLIVTRKEDTTNDPNAIPVAIRQIEQWSTTLQAAGGSGGYASLTGPGQTTTPGNLTQMGGLHIIDAGAAGFTVSESGTAGINLTNTGAGGVTINDTSSTGITLFEFGSTGSVNIKASATSGSGGNISLNTIGGGSVGGEISLVSTGFNGVVIVAENGQLHLNQQSTGSAITIDNVAGNTSGIGIQDNGTGGININCASHGINISCSGSTGFIGIQGPSVDILADVTTANVRGLGGTIIGSSVGGSTLGFYGITGVTQQAHCVTLADVITVLANLGLTT